MFYVGQEVECIDPTWGAPTGSELQKRNCPNLPVKGGIYHIRWTSGMRVVKAGGLVTMVRLYEIINPYRTNLIGPGQEACFFGYKYRPIIRVVKENHHVTEILNKYKSKVDT